MATNKARQSVKQLATKGDVKSARILAREVVRSNKQKDRLSVSKARLGSISNQLAQQLGRQPVHCMRLPLTGHFSYGEGYRVITEVYRDHEAFELLDPAAPDQSDYA